MAEKKPAVKKGKIPPKATAYKLEGSKITKIKKECPRCGAGTFMARHKDRSYCGRCHYTEFTTAAQQPQQQQQHPHPPQPQQQQSPQKPQQQQQQQPAKKA